MKSFCHIAPLFIALTCCSVALGRIPDDASPVRIAFFYESLCPGCREVFSKQIYPVWEQTKGSAILAFGFSASKALMWPYPRPDTNEIVEFAWSNDDRVKVEVFIESLCPDCKKFITQQLWGVWNELKPYGLMELDIIPYGNAEESGPNPDGSFNYTCQHGNFECFGNLIETCVMEKAKGDASKFMPIIYCMESDEDPIAAVNRCIKKGKMSPGEVFVCAVGPEGNALMHKNAQRTKALNPSHTYVPWIVVNGKHTEKMQHDAEEDLLGLVCRVYKGKKPNICANLISHSNADAITIDVV